MNSNGAAISNASKSGLDGVIAAETRLSDVDGERGKLIIAGRDIEALTGQVSFEAAVGLLLDMDEAQVAAELGRGRDLAAERLPRLGDALTMADGMDALRATVAQLPESTTALQVVAAVGVFSAAWVSQKEGRAPTPPDPSAPHAADVLRSMLPGLPPSAAEIRAFESYLVTVIDHGMNASTFAARVVASTGSDLVSSVVAAIGALKGPLHGGAPGPVLDMLDAIGTPQNAEFWLNAQLDAGQRVMGMGHRIYRVRDPRAAVLERALLALNDEASSHPRLELARAVEKTAERLLAQRHPGRALPANVEFYTALLLEAVHVPRAAFTLVFACGRVAGWCAHVAEQRAHGRLIRPASRYIGPATV